MKHITWETCGKSCHCTTATAQRQRLLRIWLLHTSWYKFAPGTTSGIQLFCLELKRPAAVMVETCGAVRGLGVTQIDGLWMGNRGNRYKKNSQPQSNCTNEMGVLMVLETFSQFYCIENAKEIHMHHT